MEPPPTCVQRKSVNKYNPDYPVFIPFSDKDTFDIVRKIKEDSYKRTYEVLFNQKPAIAEFYDNSLGNTNFAESPNSVVCLWNTASLFDIAPRILDHSFCENSNSLLFITYEYIPLENNLKSYLKNILEKNIKSFDDIEIISFFELLSDIYLKLLMLFFKAHIDVENWDLKDFIIESDGLSIYYINYTDNNTSFYTKEELHQILIDPSLSANEIAIAHIKKFMHSFFEKFSFVVNDIISSDGEISANLLSRFLPEFFKSFLIKLDFAPTEFLPDDFMDDESQMNSSIQKSFQHFIKYIRECIAKTLKMDEKDFSNTEISKRLSKKIGKTVKYIKNSEQSMHNNVLTFSNCNKYDLSSYINRSSLKEIPYNVYAKIAIIRIEKDEEDYEQYIVHFNDKKAQLYTKKSSNAQAKEIDAPKIYAWHRASAYGITPKILNYFFCGGWTSTENYTLAYEYRENTISLQQYLNEIYLRDYATLYKDDDDSYFREMIKGLRAVMLCYKTIVEMSFLANVFFKNTDDISISFVRIRQPVVGGALKKKDIQFVFTGDQNIAELPTDDKTVLSINQKTFLKLVLKYIKNLPSSNIFILVLKIFLEELYQDIDTQSSKHILPLDDKKSVTEYIQKIIGCLKSGIHGSFKKQNIIIKDTVLNILDV